MSDTSLHMDWKAERPAIEIAAESIAAACVGGATAFAVWSAAPPAVAWLFAVTGGVLAAAGALFLMRRVDRPRKAGDRFVPVDFTGEAVLAPNDAADDEGALLLDDPLPALDEDSRVVRLFAAPATAEPSAALPPPGEMAARIEDFLGVTRAAPAAASPVPFHPPVEDASAALHAALADIRRSLRQA
jgi:hypothetical protein